MENLIVYKGISTDRLVEILAKIKTVEIGFIGDLCIDIYWIADMKKSELSRETPHFPLPIVEERFQLGAGGNVIANLCALKPQAVYAVGITGDDWRGSLVTKCLNELGVSMDNIVQYPGKTTYAYCKPMRTGISDIVYEDPRLDFLSEPLTTEAEDQIIDKLEKIAKRVNTICVSDQFINGCITDKVRDKISEIASRGKIVVVDSRDRITKYRNVILKPNEIETVNAAANLTGFDKNKLIKDDIFGFLQAADILQKELKCDISMTLGSRGNIQFYNGKAIHILPREIEEPLDFCGAGDTFLSAYTCSLAAGASYEEAGQIASIASEVTICKLGQTGTADENEIIKMFKNKYI